MSNGYEPSRNVKRKLKHDERKTGDTGEAVKPRVVVRGFDRFAVNKASVELYKTCEAYTGPWTFTVIPEGKHTAYAVFRAPDASVASGFIKLRFLGSGTWRMYATCGVNEFYAGVTPWNMGMMGGIDILREEIQWRFAKWSSTDHTVFEAIEKATCAFCKQEVPLVVKEFSNLKPREYVFQKSKYNKRFMCVCCAVDAGKAERSRMLLEMFGVEK